MNKIVREHYPASKLPAELREGLAAGASVRVTVEEELPRRTPTTPEELKQQLKRVRDTLQRPVTTEEAVKRIRVLRDEWDD